MKIVLKDIAAQRRKILKSIKTTHLRLEEVLESKAPEKLFYAIKFNKIGCDPLNLKKHWNLIEQVNQTFTYLVSLKAAEILYKECKSIEIIEFNLGTQDGFDLIGIDAKGRDVVAAEVFAAVSAHNNDKLRKDIKKVMTSNAEELYVFFAADHVPASNPYTGYQPQFDMSRVKIVSIDSQALWK
jgi:hypothetical protein